MNFTKEFKGKLTTDGDDGHCWGVHIELFNKMEKIKWYNEQQKKHCVSIKRKDFFRPNPVDFLDEIAEKYPDKKATIKIEVIIED